ncbi:MAG: NUDIX hydrolase [Acidimicrobiales bacterium]
MQTITTSVTADLVALSIREGRLHVLLKPCSVTPFRRRQALLGEFLGPDVRLEEDVRAQLAEASVTASHLEQLGTFDSPDRDPRGRIVSVAYLALVAAGGPAELADRRRWTPVDTAAPLAFDHGAILAAAVERLRERLEYSTVAAALCPTEFSVTELRTVYEVVWGRPLDASNFHRKVIGTEGFLEATGRRVPLDVGVGRPPALYRRGPATVLHPGILREQAP